jgi:hypothetical protein
MEKIHMRQRRQGKQKLSDRVMLISENRAAQLLERDRGTIKRALRGIDPDSFEQEQPRYRLGTVMRAVAAHTSLTSKSRSSGASSIEVELVALEQADIAVKAFLKRLRGERDIEGRRLLARSEGRVIGALDQAFEASITAQVPDATAVYTPLRNEVIGSAINELLSLCNWNIAV